MSCTQCFIPGYPYKQYGWIYKKHCLPRGSSLTGIIIVSIDYTLRWLTFESVSCNPSYVWNTQNIHLGGNPRSGFCLLVLFKMGCSKSQLECCKSQPVSICKHAEFDTRYQWQDLADSKWVCFDLTKHTVET